MFHICRYKIVLLDGKLFASADRHDYWIHIVLNFMGPKNEERIIVYNNGEEDASDQTINMNNNFTHGKGRIVIGRHYSELNGKYASIQLDELFFFNEALTETQVMLLRKYIYYWWGGGGVVTEHSQPQKFKVS